MSHITIAEVNLPNDKVALRVEFSRIEKKNALTQAMYAQMTEALQRAQRASEVVAVVFVGTAGVFTAGNDLHDFLAMDNINSDAPVFQFLQQLAECPVPIIAAVDGLAIGIGTTMLLHCDFVFASRKSSFALPFVQLGLVPEAASSLLLPQQVGYLKAAEWLLLGERFSAEQAHEAGLLNRLSDDVEADVQRTIETLANRSVASVRASKQLMKAPPESITERTQREIKVFEKALASPAAKAAIQHILKKSH